jgi:hypothetical protein
LHHKFWWDLPLYVFAFQNYFVCYCRT